MSYVISVSDEERTREVAFYLEDIALDSGMCIKEIIGSEVLRALKIFKEDNENTKGYDVREIFKNE